MKIMANDSSATAPEKPHVTKTSNTKFSNALKRRAQAVIQNRSLDGPSRALVRYGLKTNDPWLAELVRRADAGETIVDTIDFSETPVIREEDLSEAKIEALTEMICRAGDEAATKSAALLVLMATLETATHPKALSNMAKHLAFTRCGEFNLYGMVDAQIAVLEGELLSGNTLLC
jgi:hypothetical protein